MMQATVPVDGEDQLSHSLRTREEAGGDAGRRDMGAAAARRQCHDQGAGVPVAGDVGPGRVRDLDDLAKAKRIGRTDAELPIRSCATTLSTEILAPRSRLTALFGHSAQVKDNRSV